MVEGPGEHGELLLQEARLQNGTLFQNKLLLVSLMRLQKGKGFNKGLIEAK